MQLTKLNITYESYHQYIGKKHLRTKAISTSFKRNLHQESFLTNAKGEETMGVMLRLSSWIIQLSMQLTITHMLLR